MRYIIEHIRTIIGTYDGSMPLAHFLKKYCSNHPKLGSRDRKILNEMAYNWYRVAKGLNSDADIETNLQICMRLCKSSMHFPFRNEYEQDVLFDLHAIFPFDIQLSDGIEKSDWLASMLSQPKLFIRIIKDKEKIIKLLGDNDISFSYITDTCVTLPNGAKVNELLPADCYVVQDASSQETGNYFKPVKGESWYDCCSGAGGKSLLLKGLQPNVRLTVSDKRSSILHNLETRFRQYHYQPPEMIVVDVADKAQLHKTLVNNRFDNIICDVPCSGSGTWARTPENMYFFKPESIASFSTLQTTIATNVCTYLKSGGRMIYITCSVFRQENEHVIEQLVNTNGLKALEIKLINGIDKHADSMFVAVLQKT